MKNIVLDREAEYEEINTEYKQANGCGRKRGERGLRWLGVFVWMDRFDPIQTSESELISVFKTWIQIIQTKLRSDPIQSNYNSVGSVFAIRSVFVKTKPKIQISEPYSQSKLSNWIIRFYPNNEHPYRWHTRTPENAVAHRLHLFGCYIHKSPFPVINIVNLMKWFFIIVDPIVEIYRSSKVDKFLIEILDYWHSRVDQWIASDQFITAIVFRISSVT
ncbi:hypothetical protein LXL04_036225 [Taraxacum kok-saghyz]